MYRTRAKLRRGAGVSGPDKLLNYAYERIWLPATYKYPLMAREFLKSVQMREVSSPLVRLRVVWLMCLTWFQSWFRPLRRATQATRMTTVPPREEFLRRVGAQSTAASRVLHTAE